MTMTETETTKRTMDYDATDHVHRRTNSKGHVVVVDEGSCSVRVEEEGTEDGPLSRPERVALLAQIASGALRVIRRAILYQ